MRLLVVSNRLPVTVEEKDGEYLFQESVGGLVSGLSAYLESMRGAPFTQSEYAWVGWPGIAVADEKQKEVKARILSDFHACPVFIPKETMDNFYLGFCNSTIWPLFHYFPSYAAYNEEYWKCYRRVNELFCDSITEILRPDDIVWIQDYHLMLLPGLLRARMPDAAIGFFLHIPFPSFEIYRLLPQEWRSEILTGLLGSDLIGFHTHDYTQYFLRCVLRILGHEHNMGQLVFENRIVRADTFPMGIDYRKYVAASSSAEVEKERIMLQSSLEGYKVILSVDRLDYSKGILNRLRAFEIFLGRNPDYYGRVILILVVVPSRIGVIDYQQMKRQIDENVGRINSAFGSITWTPIRYLYKYESLHPLVALYRLSDVALVTPLRDGMNLVAKEYIASRNDSTGVLVLSEMAGAAKELGEAIIINPNDIGVVADALREALELSPEEQIRRNRIMQNRLERYDVVRWAGDFIQKLMETSRNRGHFHSCLLSQHERETLVEEFRRAGSRLLFLDYDGTLVPFAGRPEMALPGEDVMQLLASLANDPKNEVVLISGRDRITLENWFGRLNVNLVSEHGAWVREKGDGWRLTVESAADWKPHLFPLLEMYADRLPGALIEEKDYSLAWHYRIADPEQSSAQANELMDDLVQFTANINVQILQGNKVIEVRNAGINKGVTGRYFLTKYDSDFIFAAGDDWTDEDLFCVLPATANTVKVGLCRSYARYNLRNHVQVRELIKEMIS
ncbi:MAG: bifunctional alpha,alpha-trehalose-phosphate synthase (UDP-forming)/trehalose-phosphatase [Candidatus Latescibacterota bacterium]